MTPAFRSLVLAAGLTYASVFGFARFAYSVMLPAMRDDFGATVATMGMLASSNLMGYVLGSGLAMLLTARFRTDRVSLAGLVSVCAGLLLLAVTPGPGGALVLMFVLGVGSALAFIATTAMVSNAVPERRGRLLGFATAGIGLGTTGCSLVIAFLLEIGDDGWRWSWFALGVLLTAAVPWIHRTVSSADRERVASSGAANTDDKPTWGAVARHRRLWVFPMYVCWGAGYIVYVMFVTAFLHDERGLSVGTAALIYSVIGVAAIFGGPLVGPLSDRLTRPPLMALTMATCAGGTALLVVADTVGLYLVSAVLFGMPISAIGTLIAAYVGDLWRPIEQGPIFAGVTLLFGIAQAVTPAVVGIVTDRVGTLTPAFLFAVAILLLGAVISLVLPGRSEPPVREAKGHEPCSI